MSEPVLSARALNRALLSRQMLLAREALTPLQALRRLVALQGQVPRAPFVGLWSRLAGFDPAELLTLIRSREVVRATFLRGTLQLLAAEDFLALRPLLRTEPRLRLPNGDQTTLEELEPVLTQARAHFAEPRDFESLRAVLTGDSVEKVRNLAHAARILLPLVQAPHDTAFGYKPGGEFVMADAWLGRGLAADPDPLDLVRRYLATYGPATPADFTAWSGLKGAAALFEALGDELLRFRDPQKRLLFDLVDAPRPEPDTPATPRLLPDFDAAVLGHQDRSRVIPSEHALKAATTKNLLVPPLVLVDGFVAGTWKMEVKSRRVLLGLKLFSGIDKKADQALRREAEDLAQAFEPRLPAEIRLDSAGG